MKLSDFIQSSTISPDTLQHLVTSNKIPFYIDEDGFVCVSLNKLSAKEFIDKHITNLALSATESHATLRSEIDKIVRHELGGILEEVVERLKDLS